MLPQLLEALIRKDRSLLKADGSINQNAAARAFGIKQPTLFRVLSGETTEPRAKVVEAIAAYFGVEPAQLRGEKAIPGISASPSSSGIRLSKDESLLLSLYRSLSPSMQKAVIRVVAALKE